MKIVISPAKSLDYQSKVSTSKHTEALFLDNAAELAVVLKKKSIKDLSELMHISANLARLNYERNQQWSLPFTVANARQAIYAFKGTVYEGLDAYSIPLHKIDQLQGKLRILSGQYGLLKPLDLMQPYRLEMGTKLQVKTKKNLYQFWGTKITEALNNELKKEEPFINLASNEYFKVVQPKQLKTPVITPIFKDYKGDKLKVIAFFAKKARGMMVRYIIDHDLKEVEDLKRFNSDGYVFDSNLSTETELVFTR